MFNFGVDLVDVLNPRIRIFLAFVLVLSILRIFIAFDATLAIDGALHVVIVDDGLFHFPHLTENSLLFLSIMGNVSSQIILFLVGPAIVPSQIDELLAVHIILESALLQPIDSE